MKISFLLFSFLTFALLLKSQNMVKPAIDYLAKYPVVRDFTISIDSKEAYFTIQNNSFDISIIVRVTKSKKSWSNPKIVEFSGKYRDLEPFLAPDGLKLYFASDRPLSDTSKTPKDFDIWYVERKNSHDKWSLPINLGSPINTDSDEFYPSVSENQNLYFTCDCPNSIGSDDIFYSKWDGQYLDPIPLDSTVNSPGYEFNAYVSPDESFIIYSGYGRLDGYGGGDLYISFKNADGGWGNSENLGKSVNSKYMEYCPFVDMNTKILYFTSNRYLQDNMEIKSLNDYMKALGKYENGSSKLFKVMINDILKTKKQTIK